MSPLKDTLAKLGLALGRSPLSPGRHAGTGTVPAAAPAVLEQTRNGMTILSSIDTEDPAEDISQYLAKSPDYHNVTGSLRTLQKRYAGSGNAPLGRRIKAGRRITAARERIAAYERDARKLVILSRKISFDTPLLQEVRRHIDNAAFSPANSLLDIGELNAEQKILLDGQQESCIGPAEREARLRTNATAFFLKALLAGLDTQGRPYLTPSQLLKSSVDSCLFPENSFERCISYQKICAGSEIGPVYQEIIRSGRPEKSHLAPLALHNLGVMYMESRQPEKAGAQLHEALAFYRDAANRGSNGFGPHIAVTLANLALLCDEKKDPVQAKKMFRESVEQFRSCAKTDPGRILPALARTLKQYADTCCKDNDLRTAASCYDEATAIYLSLLPSDRERFQPLLFLTLAASSDISIRAGCDQEGAPDAAEALAHAREMAEMNPGEYLPHVATMLTRLAVIHAETGSPDRAEKEFREAIAIHRAFRKLPNQKPLHTNRLANVLNDIGVMYMNNRQPGMARREFCRSLALYQMILHNPFALLEMGQALINMSSLCRQETPDRDRSVQCASLAAYLMRPFTGVTESCRAGHTEAVQIQQYWGISESEGDRMIWDLPVARNLREKFPHLYR